MNKNLNKYYFFITCFFLFVDISGLEAQAASLYFESESKEFGVGQQFSVNLMLDPEGEEINALEGEISFSGNLDFVSAKDGGTFVGLWLKRPSFENGRFIFSGIVPGGYSGELSPYYEGTRPGKVFEIVFKANEAGLANVKIKNAKVLLNDGEGTETELGIKNYELIITDKTQDPRPKTQDSRPKDNEPPETFTPQIAQDPNIFGGKYFLAFHTKDAGSGIAYYELHESRRIKERVAADEWKVAESPYLLKDQALKSYIYVKAVDNAGNSRIETLPPQKPLRWYDNWLVWGIIIVIIFFGYRYLAKIKS